MISKSVQGILMPFILARLFSRTPISWNYFVLVSGPFVNLSSDFISLVDCVALERSLHTTEIRDFTPEVILSMQKRALIRRIGLYLYRGCAQHIFDGWRDAVSSCFSPSSSDDFDLLTCDTSLDFQYRGAYRGID